MFKLEMPNLSKLQHLLDMMLLSCDAVDDDDGDDDDVDVVSLGCCRLLPASGEAAHLSSVLGCGNSSGGGGSSSSGVSRHRKREREIYDGLCVCLVVNYLVS